MVGLMFLLPIENRAFAEKADGLLLLKKGKEAWSAGNINESINFLEKACQREAFYSVNEYIESINFLGKIYYETGQIDKGLILFKRAENVTNQLSDIKRKINFFSLYGMFFSAAGLCDEGSSYHEKAVKEARLLPETLPLAHAYANMGSSMSECGFHEESTLLFKKSIETIGMNQNKNYLFLARLLLNLASEKFNTGKLKQVIDYLYKAEQYTNKILDIEKPSYYLSIAILSEKVLKKSDLQTAKELKMISFRVMMSAKACLRKSTPLRIKSEIYGVIGRLYLLEKRFEEALLYTRKALFVSGQKNLPQSQYRWQWQLADIFYKSGDNEKALSAYRRAMEILNPLRGDLLKTMNDDETFFKEKIKPVYSGLAKLLILKAEKKEFEQDRVSLLLEAREIMDELKSYELQDYFQDECITCDNSAKGDKKNIELDLTEKTALLYPIIFKESLVIIITLPSGTYHVKVPVHEKELTENILRFRKRLQSLPGKRFLYYSEKLYGTIIRPVENLLEKESIKTLVIVPEGVLRLVPFSAFYDGEKYLAEKYATAIIPTISAGSENTGDKNSVKNSKPEVLLCGLSKNKAGNTILPGVSDELTQIREMFGGNILLNNRFTYENLRDELNKDDFSIIHLATHGYMGGVRRDIFMETFDGEISMENLENLIKLGRFRNNKVDLLTLSACDSGVGDERAAMGLGGVALKAGVKSSLATLWYINDQAATKVVTVFYSHYGKEGISKARALQKAHITMIKSEKFNHPAYWAPFLLIGDWR